MKLEVECIIEKGAGICFFVDVRNKELTIALLCFVVIVSLKKKRKKSEYEGL